MSVAALARSGPVRLLLPALLAAAAHADVAGPQRAEVAHLLEFVRTTPCIIERNGALHDGPAAHAHIVKKYRHFRDRIATTEDFIALAATRSTVSNRAYTVRCPGQPDLETGEWLRRELERYRRQRPTGR